MTLDEIAMAAYKNRKPDKTELTVPEWLLWYRLRDVYKECVGDNEAGAKQKQIVLNQYEQDRKDWVKTKEVYDHMSSQWKRIETPAREFARSRTVDDGIKFFEAVYQVPMQAQQEQWERRDAK